MKFWLALLLVPIFSTNGQCAPDQPAGAAITAFVDVTVVPMDRERVLPHQTVLIRGDRIQEVGPADRVNVPTGSLVIDGRDRFLIPGLTDSHIHFAGYSNAGAGDVNVEKAVLWMLLANGVTTAINMEGTPAILSLRDDLQNNRVVGPTLYSTGPLLQMPGSGEPPGRKTFMTPEDVAAEVRAEKQAGYDFVKVHGDLPEETYRTLLATAKQVHIRVVGHTPSNLGLDATLNGGQELIVHAEEFLYSYFQFHRDLPTDSKEIDRMIAEVSLKTAKSGVWVSPTLSVFHQIILQIADIDATLHRPAMRYMPLAPLVDWRAPGNPYLKRWTVANIPKFRAQYSIMQKLVRGLRDAGVPLLVGTDPFVPCQIPGFSMKDEFEQMYAAGLTPYEVLKAATFNGAQFLGISDQSGTIAIGKRADLVLVNANPLEDVDNVFRQDGIMLHGRWLTENELQARLSYIAATQAVAH